MNIKFTIYPYKVINFIIGVLIICLGLYLLEVKPAENFGQMCQQILGMIAIGIGGQFKLFKGE